MACGRRTGGAGTSQVRQATRGIGHLQPVKGHKSAAILPCNPSKPFVAGPAQSPETRGFLWYGPAPVSGRSKRAAARLAGVSAVVLAVVSAAAAAPPAGNDASGVRARTHDALLDLYALDSRLSAARARLATLESQAARLREQQSLLSQQLSSTRRTLQGSQQRLAKNLRTLYEQGEIDPLAVVLGAQSLDEAVAVTTNARERLTLLRSTIADRRARLDTAVASAKRTADDLAAAHAARVSFIESLRLKARQLTALQAAAQRVQAKSQELQSAAARSPDPAGAEAATASAPAPVAAPAASSGPAAPAPSGGGKTLTVSSTGYALPGRTATGIPVGWGVVAVDPNVIPLGTRMTIPGYGEGVAADTGGAVRGATIDVWFPTQAQALAWGRRTVTITLH
jgi:3D (Asp-Asp-Asp) domain-containing protein